MGSTDLSKAMPWRQRLTQNTEGDDALEPDIFGITVVENWQVDTHSIKLVTTKFLAIYTEGGCLCFFPPWSLTCCSFSPPREASLSAFLMPPGGPQKEGRGYSGATPEAPRSRPRSSNVNGSTRPEPRGGSNSGESTLLNGGSPRTNNTPVDTDEKGATASGPEYNVGFQDGSRLENGPLGHTGGDGGGGCPPKRERTLVESIRWTCWHALTYTWVNILLVFVPAGIATAQIPGVHGGVVFALNCLAVIPLAGMLAHATEAVAADVGDALGALMNVTLGNAVELIIL